MQTVEDIDTQLNTLDDDAAAEIGRLEKMQDQVRRETRAIDAALKPLIVDAEDLHQDLRLKYAKLWGFGDTHDAVRAACSEREQRISQALAAKRREVDSKRNALQGAKREIEAARAAAEAQEQAEIAKLRDLLGKSGVKLAK